MFAKDVVEPGAPPLFDLWVRWSIDGQEVGRKKISNGAGGLSPCIPGGECPPPADAPPIFAGFYAGSSYHYVLVQRGKVVTVEDHGGSEEGCGPDGCGEPGAPPRLIEIPVPKGAKVYTRIE
jgi:hypothetical protein